MLESLFGNSTIEKILYFVSVYGEAYAKQMSDIFSIPVNGIQQQLRRLEEGGVFVSQLKGKTRLYQFNPRYPFLKELKALLDKAVSLLQENEIEKYYRRRARPRRRGKRLKE